MLNQLRFGRGIDNRRYKASGFEYGYTSRETVTALAEHLRLHPILRGVEQSYTYEGEVERFLRRSPLTRPPEPRPRRARRPSRSPSASEPAQSAGWCKAGCARALRWRSACGPAYTSESAVGWEGLIRPLPATRFHPSMGRKASDLARRRSSSWRSSARCSSTGGTSTHKDKIAEGVTIGGVDVGGLEADAAASQVRTEPGRAAREDPHRHLRRGGLRADREGGRRPHRHRRDGRRGARGLPGGRHPRRAPGARSPARRSTTRSSPKLVYDDDEVDHFVNHIANVVDRDPVDAGIDPSGGTLQPVPPQPGAQGRRDKLRRQVETALYDPAARKIEAEVEKVKPEVTTAEVAEKYPTYIVVNRSNFTLTLYKRPEARPRRTRSRSAPPATTRRPASTAIAEQAGRPGLERSRLRLGGKPGRAGDSTGSREPAQGSLDGHLRRRRDPRHRRRRLARQRRLARLRADGRRRRDRPLRPRRRGHSDLHRLARLLRARSASGRAAARRGETGERHVRDSPEAGGPESAVEALPPAWAGAIASYEAELGHPPRLTEHAAGLRLRPARARGVGDRGGDHRPGRGRIPPAARLRRGARAAPSRALDRRRKLAATRGLFEHLTQDRSVDPEPGRAAAEPAHRIAAAPGPRPRRDANPARSDPSRHPARGPRPGDARARLLLWPALRRARRPRPASRSTSRARPSGSPARAARSGSSRSGSRPSAPSPSTWSAPARRSSPNREERALLVSKSGRRLSPSDVTRRLGRWVSRGGDRRPRHPARPPALVRHPHARGGRRPAVDPGAARAREHLDHPDLHAG